MSRLLPGGPIPLFDKLSQTAIDPDGGLGHMLSASGVEDSVARELARLTNSRSRLTIDAFFDAELSVLDYGIPDYSARSAQSEADRRMIQQAIAKAITVFEPRLTDVEVALVQNPMGKFIAHYAISGNLRIEKTSRRISFNIAADEMLQPAANRSVERG